MHVAFAIKPIANGAELIEASLNSMFSNIHAENRLLGSLATRIGSGSTPRGGRAFYPSSGIPFIRSLNVRMREFRREGLAFIDEATHERMKETHAKPNDVLLNITGASIGRVACVPDDLPFGNVSQHVMLIRPGPDLDPRYLMYWASQPIIQSKIKDLLQRGGTRMALTKTQVEAFEIPVPSLTKQIELADRMDKLGAHARNLYKLQKVTGDELESLFSAILASAFSRNN